MPTFVHSGHFDRKSNEHLQAPSPLTNGFIKQEQKIINTFLVGKEGKLKGCANHIHAVGLISQTSLGGVEALHLASAKEQLCIYHLQLLEASQTHPSREEEAENGGGITNGHWLLGSMGGKH